MQVWLDQFKSISNPFVKFQNLYSISYSEAVISLHGSIGFPHQIKLAQTRIYGYTFINLNNAEQIK